MEKVNDMLISICDQHAPIKKMSNKKIKQQRNPWITNSILKKTNKSKKLLRKSILPGNLILTKQI
jgi:hypothetical protein